jgi:hypothetical protein
VFGAALAPTPPTREKNPAQKDAKTAEIQLGRGNTVMKAIAPTEQNSLLLARYQEVGGVVEHVFIDPGEDDRPREVVHREAALLTLRSFATKIDAYFERLIRTPDYRNRSRSEFFTVTIDPDLLTGQRVTPDAFLGSGWDRKSRHATDDCEMTGYAYAFFKPPHGLRNPGARPVFSKAAAAELFRSVTDALFDGFSDSLTIFEWSADCSNYFDAGREWWGTFFWTVEVPRRNWIVGVAASTTD